MGSNPTSSAKMKKSVLIYAFSSWGGKSKNVSQEVLQALEVQADKVTLKVKFEYEPYKDIVKRGYNLIVGLGQYPRGRSIRIERFAQNLFGSRAKGYVPIELGGPDKIELDLRLTPMPGVLFSDDAGRFVCNFSMYTLMRHKKKETKLAFFHIPKQVGVDWATEVVSKLLAQVGVQ